MTLIKKVRAVENLFKELDKNIAKFQLKSQLHCISGCSTCCKNPKIDATALEMLPLAFHYYCQSGIETQLERIKSLNEKSSMCAILAHLQISGNNNGGCKEYKYRGLVCRLFGYSAYLNKLSEKSIVTCKIIKEDQVDNFNKANLLINTGLKIPVWSDYYQKLKGIDSRLTDEMQPINYAIIEAMEYVLEYYSYRRPYKPVNKAS